jgi:hypothetical protein
MMVLSTAFAHASLGIASALLILGIGLSSAIGLDLLQ